MKYLFESKSIALPKMNFFENITTFATNLASDLQGVAMSIIVACIVITGLMFVFGEGPSRTAKKWLTYIVIGSIVVFGAGTIGTTIKSVGGF